MDIEIKNKVYIFFSGFVWVCVNYKSLEAFNTIYKARCK